MTRASSSPSNSLSKDAVAASGPAPAGCRIELQEPVSDQQTTDAKTMLATKGVDWQAPPEEDFGAMFAQPIAVACGGIPQAVAAGPDDLKSRTLVGPRQGPALTPSLWADPAAFRPRHPAVLLPAHFGGDLRPAFGPYLGDSL